MSENKYVIAVIFSNWTLTEIFAFLEDYVEGKQEQVGAARIDRYRNKRGEIQESNRTLVLMDRELYQCAVEKGLNTRQTNLDFQISEYQLNEKHYPKENQRANIFLSFPKEIPYKDVDLQLKEKLKILKQFGLIKHHWKLVIPLVSRETEEHKGYGYLNFTKDNLDARTFVKILLHDSKLYSGEERHFLKAYWAKDKTK